MTVPEHKVRALLASLLVNPGRLVSANRLIEQLWRDDPPTNVMGALHTRVWQLRRTLEKAEAGASDLVVSRAPGYLLRVDADAVDAQRFQRLTIKARRTESARAKAAMLADALDLWRGPAFVDFPDDQFARTVAVQLEEQRLTAVEERAEVMLELGDHGLLVGELGDLVAQHPLRERLRAAHMKALYRAGMQTEALHSFDELYRLLTDRFGLEPGIELKALRQAILEHDPALKLRQAPVTTTPRAVTNLPASLGALIGRDAAVPHVRSLTQANRLVTLNGLGGVGKTSLALAVARDLVDSYPDGVWLVELAMLDRPGSQEPSSAYADVVDLVATVLGIRDELASGDLVEGRSTPLDRRLADALGARQFLLLLDNCEHVVEPAAKLTDMLLKAVPGLHVLATSREPLGIAGEQLWTVPPLVFPDGESLPQRRVEAEQCSAVRLFLARAASAAPNFTVHDGQWDDVFAICRRLDGIPFALELAATRVRTLGLREVAARLADRFNLLTIGRRGAPARQQTLRAAIDWSWEMLTERDRAVLRRLSVHTGDFTLGSAEEISAGGPVEASEVMDVVASLVDRSLVSVKNDANGARYRLLESVSAYCSERLREAGESDDVRYRHACWYVRFAERARAHLHGPDQLQWLRRLDDESANLRGALDHATQRGLADLALRLVNALAWYWFLRGRLGEASRSLAAALGVAGDVCLADRAKALTWRAGFAVRAGDSGYSPQECDSALRRAAETGDTSDDPLGLAMAQWFLGFAYVRLGDPTRGEKRIAEALTRFRDLGDRWGTAAVLSTRAAVAVLRGDLRSVQRYGEQSAAQFRELGDGWGYLQATDTLAHLAEVKGDYERAGRLHRDGLRIAEKLGLWMDVSTRLSGLGRVALLAGDYDQARQLHERAMRVAAEQSYTFGEQFAEVGLGMGARRQGDLDAAEAHLRRWLDWCRRSHGDNGAALILAELGFVAEARGDAETALRLHTEGFEAARVTRDLRTIALSLEGLAGAHAIVERHHCAAILLGAAAAARERVGAPLPAAESGDVDRITARTRAVLGAPAFGALFEQGRGRSPDEAVVGFLMEPVPAMEASVAPAHLSTGAVSAPAPTSAETEELVSGANHRSQRHRSRRR